ncbi:5549_t:CDS:2 [Cetraspora pellucida]|uniref:5549_t:CDS:1 n=1 Tax=Cetraspora pellucida TaxID=1433469 RepID=A0ACA9LVY4_9GLOM|nr:5549_t:CDS:2 [Cetraspora pellucida]
MVSKLPNSFFDGDNESEFNNFDEYPIAPTSIIPVPFIPNGSSTMKLSDPNAPSINFQPNYYLPYLMNYYQNEIYPHTDEILFENLNMTEQFSMPTLEISNGIPLKSPTPKQRPQIQQPIPGSQSSTTNVHNSKDSTIKPRKYKCDICLKLFVRPSQLKTHMHTHTGMKPFRCTFEGCGRCFSVVSNLHRHQKIHMKSSLPKT